MRSGHFQSRGCEVTGFSLQRHSVYAVPGGVLFSYGGWVLLAVDCRLVAALLTCVVMLAALNVGAASLQPFTAFAVNEGEIRAAISRAKEAGPRPDEPV